MDSESSDEDLPDIFGSQPTPLSEEIFVGNIVWAMFRNLYWPALIRKVNKKERKVSVWYLDSPGKCFKVPFRKLSSFQDHAVCQKIHEEASQSPNLKSQHQDIFMKALIFKKRKIEGKIDDPLKFFTPSAAYLALSDLNYTPKSNKSYLSRFDSTDLPLANDSTENEDSFSESEAGIGSDADTKNIRKFSSGFFESGNDDADVEKENAIVSYIKSGKLDKYLMDIKHGKIHSSWKEFFENSMKTEPRALLNITPTGSHITDYKRLRDIVTYLLNLYETNVVGEKHISTKYVHYVWLPEALEKTVSSIEVPSIKSQPASRELFKDNSSTTETMDSGSKDNSPKVKSPKRLKSKNPGKVLKVTPQKSKRKLLHDENGISDKETSVRRSPRKSKKR